MKSIFNLLEDLINSNSDSEFNFYQSNTYAFYIVHYDKLVDSLINRTFYKVMKTDFIGFVYKADIFALGITLGFIRRHFRLYNDRKLTDLISKMIKLNPVSRPSIIDCLAHPFIQN